MCLSLINMKLFTSLMFSGKAKVMAVFCEIWESMVEYGGVWLSVGDIAGYGTAWENIVDYCRVLQRVVEYVIVYVEYERVWQTVWLSHGL